MSANTYISQSMLWSGQMVLRTLQKVLAENAYNNLPTKFIKEMEAMKTVLTLEQLMLKLEPMAKICLTELGIVAGGYDFNSLIKDIVAIRKREEFPMFLDLDGYINNLESGGQTVVDGQIWNDQADIKLLMTQKSSLLIVIHMILEYQTNEFHANFKHCSLLIGYFYADRLARRFDEECCFGMPYQQAVESVSAIGREIFKEKIELNPTEDRLMKTINSSNFEKLVTTVFKDSDYYLIPEFRHSFREAAKKSNKRTCSTAPCSLYSIAITFERFFEALSKYPMFSPKKFQLIENAIMGVKLYQYSRHVQFTMSTNRLIDHKYPKLQRHITPNDDPLALIDKDQFNELLSVEKITDFGNPSIEIAIHRARRTFPNPIISPRGQLCIPASEAFSQWAMHLQENSKFILFSENLNELEDYLEKSVAFFTKDKKTYMHAMDYKEFEALTKEGKKFYAKENKKVADKTIPSSVAECEMLLQGSIVARKFPIMLHIMRIALNGPNVYLEFSNSLQFAILFKYPQLALFAHYQQMCGIQWDSNRQPYCYLDFTQDVGMARPARCQHAIPGVLKEMLAHGVPLRFSFEATVKQKIEMQDVQKKILPKKKEVAKVEQVMKKDEFGFLHDMSEDEVLKMVRSAELYAQKIMKSDAAQALIKDLQQQQGVPEVESIVQYDPTVERNNDVQVFREHEKTIECLKKEVQQLKADAQNRMYTWNTKEQKYKERIDEYDGELKLMAESRDEMVAQVKVWKAKEKKSQDENEEVKKLREQMKMMKKENDGWKEKEKEYQRKIESTRAEVNTLMSKMGESKMNLEAQVKLQKAKEIEYQKGNEKHKMEMKKLREEMKKLKDDMSKKEEEGAGDSGTRKIVNNAKELIKSFEEYQQEWKSQMESARIILQEFTIHSKNKLDVEMAEKELKCYELTTGGWMKMVDENMKMLKGKDIQYDLLFEVKELPSTVFSGGMIEKMEKVRKEKMMEEQNKKECVICHEDMLTKERMFKCFRCSNECHADCYAKWAVTSATCPLCRQTNPNDEEFPALR